MTIVLPSCLDAGLPTVEEALLFVASRFSPPGESERVPLKHAPGRVIAQGFIAAASMPPWPRAAMDGFAFRSGSGAPLRLVGAATAGRPFQGAAGHGECVAISTGAAVPQSCDTVVMREQCECRGDDVWLGALVFRGANVRPPGEDYREGDLLLQGGTRLDARAIGLLASTGARHVTVQRKLRVAIFSVGDELGTGPIFDSNCVMLKSRLANHEVTDLGLLPDCRARIEEVLANAATTHDMIISTGGTSAGDEDHVRAALLEAGGGILVSGVAIKPGKPVTCARLGRALYVALPGNPVAALVTFLALGEPLLHHLGGAGLQQARPCAVRAAFEYRKKQGLREYLRVTLQDMHEHLPLAKANRAESAQLHALALSDGLVCLDETITGVSPGDILPCHLFFFWTVMVKVPCVILAGGLSSRMGGGDKGLLPLGGKPLLTHVLELVKPQTSAILINTNSDAPEFRAFGPPVAGDTVGGFKGPLAGVLTGMIWAREKIGATHVLSVPCDTPFLPADLTCRLQDAMRLRGAEIAIACDEDRSHPVIGLWPVALAHKLAADLADGARAIHRWLTPFDVCDVRFAAHNFHNINTPAQFQQVEGRLHMLAGLRQTDVSLPSTNVVGGRMNAEQLQQTDQG